MDDEKAVLLVLQAFMQRLSRQWEACFVEGGPQALALFDQQPFDVVISDMRMPDMDGVHLLSEVMKRHSPTVRIIFSGHADEQTVQESVGVAHQWIAKPFELKTLKALLDRISASRDRIEQESLKEVISKIDRLPSVPRLYFEILEALRSPVCSTQVIAEIITQDPSLTAKILKLVNSAFFGIARNITTAAEAVQLLGVSRIRSLALTHHIFCSFDQRIYQDLSVEEVWSHSLETALWARQIVVWQHGGRIMEETAFTGGLLHDIGSLILAANLPEAYREARGLARSRNSPMYDAEKEVFNATHADVGAYLLSIWGLPVSLVETVALHHEPALAIERIFSALAAVHVANACSYEQKRATLEIPGTPVDQNYLNELGVLDRLSVWRRQLNGQ